MLHKVISIRNLSQSTYVLRIERKDFSFKPGQCVNIGVKGSGVNREYSTYSGVDDPYLEFLIKEIKGGAVSSATRNLAPDAEVDLHGPFGSFVINPDKIKGSHFVFVSTGTGIAPFHSFVRSFPDLSYEVISGVRTQSEFYDSQDYDPSKTTWCVSRETWEGFNGRVSDYLKGREIDTSNYFYLCGNQKMISDVYDILRDKDLSGDHIITEAFF